MLAEQRGKGILCVIDERFRLLLQYDMLFYLINLMNRIYSIKGPVVTSRSRQVELD